MIYLDNAATSYPKPDSVLRAMVKAANDYGANPGRGGHKMTIKAGEVVYDTRQRIADMFSCESDRVIFTNNCTTALNMAIKGSVSKGCHVIISSLEHNSVLRPVHKLSETGYITYSVAKVNPLSDDETVKSFLSLIRKDTTLIVCTAVSNVFGTVLPIRRIADICKRKNIRFIVDAAQAAGAFKIDMKKTGIDILCMPGHKGLYGIMGTGALLLSDNADVSSFCEGGTGSFSLTKNQPDVYPDKLESGTHNLPGIASLGEGVKFISSQGGESAIHQKEMHLCRMLLEDLSAIKNIRTYRNIAGRHFAPVVAFNVKGRHSEQTAELLDKSDIAVRAGYHCSYLAHKTYGTDKEGIVRVSPGYFNTKKDIKNLVFCVNKIAMGNHL